MTGLHYVGQASELALGDLVFKAAEPGDSNYDLPAAYRSGKDKRDYYHVGVVTSVSPLCITHCTGVPGGIKRDNTLGKWHYAGQLNLIDNERGDSMNVDYMATVSAANGNTVNLRANPSAKANVLTAVKVGTRVQVVEEVDADWAKIIIPDNKTGYMMRKFLKEDEADTGDEVTIHLPGGTAKALYAALVKAGVVL